MLFGKHVNEYYLKYSIYYIIGILALIFVDRFQLRIPDIIGDIIDGLEAKTLTVELLKDYMLNLMLIALVLFIGRFLWRICLLGNGVRVETDLRNKLFKAMIKLSQRFFLENKTGNLMSLYTNDLATIRQVFGSGVLMLVDALALGILTVIKMLQLNVTLTLINMGTLILISATTFIVGKKIRKATRENFDAYGRLSEFVQEDFTGISVIKAFVKEKLQGERFEVYNQENMDTCIHMVRIRARLEIFIEGFLWLVYITTIALGSYIIYTNAVDTTLTIGELTKFLAYCDTLIWPIMAVGRIIALQSQGRASLDRMGLILDQEVEINDNLVDDVTLNDIKNNEFKGKIEYRNLSFKYPTSDHLNLRGVSFTINPGEFVGLVGQTGSGKSTIVDLLLRIYNIDEGLLFIDDHDIMHLPIKYVRDNISYVPQDNFLYSDTIEKNIAFSESGEIDHEKVIMVSKLSDVYKDIVEFKDGFDTVLGERGVTVSGGQKQRISMARALYKNSSILILDDSLSAVDTETEKQIITNLRDIRKGKTTIIIAHRITTLMQLDKIIVMEKQIVSAVGTHEELLTKSSVYKREVELQELEKEFRSDEARKDGE